MVDPMPRFSTVSAEAGSAALAMVKLAAAANATDKAVLLDKAMKSLPDCSPVPRARLPGSVVLSLGDSRSGGNRAAESRSDAVYS
jgi:hypothetical protein